jgi:formylglycine-generating enzyme required for sulfatase activity
MIAVLFNLVIAMVVSLANAAFAGNVCPHGMAFIPGGTFSIGSDNSGYVEENSAPDVSVSSFCMDRYEVTNAQFAEFVLATGYVTVAERPLQEQRLLPGSIVFQVPQESNPPHEVSWWKWVTGASWKHPFGLSSNITNKENYPVVHIAYEDAVAYASWAGKSLPTEAQWEYASLGGGLDGNEYSPTRANTWQGIFPFFNTKADGYVGMAPVGSFPANKYGLYDMTGNVWEWTNDWYASGHAQKAHHLNPTGPLNSFDPNKPSEKALHVIKGGSYLCAPNYCSRYRPAARESQAPDTGTSHIGFRLVKNLT